MIDKVKCSYGVPKFKPSRQKKVHICSCFVSVFPLHVKKILVTGFELGYAVTALYFSNNFFIFLYRKETAMKKYIIQGIYYREDFVLLFFNDRAEFSMTEYKNSGAPACQKSWWRQPYVVGVICPPPSIGIGLMYLSSRPYAFQRP